MLAKKVCTGAKSEELSRLAARKVCVSYALIVLVISNNRIEQCSFPGYTTGATSFKRRVVCVL